MFYLSDICLLCLNSKQLESVLIQNDNGIAVQEELKFCLPEITVSKSGIPELICSSCRTAVHSFYKFKETCLENYSRFLQYTQILQGNSEQRGQKVSEVEIQINKKDLMIEREQDVKSVLNIKEEIEDSVHPLEDLIQRTDNIDIKEEDDLICTELQEQLNNQDFIREREQNVDSKLNITTDNQVSLQSLNEDDDKPILDDATEVREEFVASEDSDDPEFYLKFINNESASDNEEDSASKGSCEDDKQPNDDEDDCRADTNNVTANANGEEYKHNENPLNAPKRIHENVTDYKCQICNKEFIKKSALNRHLKIHVRINQFKCSICDQKFAQKGYLTDHMKIHLEIKDFICSICDRKFVFKRNLVQHMKIHSEIKEFKCSTCKKMFAHKRALKKHMKIHAEIKDFKCSVCEKMFVYKANLKVHLKMHAGIDYKCSVCDKKFGYESSLKIHMKLHEETRDFKCSICDKTFTYKGNFKIHMKMHSGIRDIQCSICEKTFIYKCSFKMHMKVMHGGIRDIK